MANTSTNICIIGAGSAQFTLDLIRDLCLTEGLHGSTVWLIGHVNREKIDLVHDVGSRYSEEMKAGLEFKRTMDRREALKNADFVINTADVRPREERRFDVYGLRQLLFFMDVIMDMEELCPDAWLLMAANPVFGGCTLMTRESGIKVVGLCHGFREGVRNMVEVMGLDPDHVTAQAAGINHNIWLTHFLYKGQDAYPLLDEWIETRAGDYWKGPEFNGGKIEWGQMGPKPIDMYKFYGLMPIGDTPRAAGAWWYSVDEETERRWMATDKDWWAAYNDNLNEKMSVIKAAASNQSLPASNFIPQQKSTGHDYINIIDAIASDQPGEYEVNIPNNGAVEGIADDVVVEIPAIVSGRGIQGIRIGRLPDRITLNLQDAVLRMEYGLKAFLAGDMNILLAAYLRDRSTKSMEEAQGKIQRLLNSDHRLALRFSDV